MGGEPGRFSLCGAAHAVGRDETFGTIRRESEQLYGRERANRRAPGSFEPTLRDLEANEAKALNPV
ncbi:hypothetical protein X754_22230 [Mesorhizobium sp. LNJC403B00]|nr:hypothetical protein X754_22230 [Mesorhizobium sp. LNJC403B00]ESZ52666.1 hypothetical protein X730_04060 [Mesorhizobium sp. L103C565B0]